MKIKILITFYVMMDCVYVITQAYSAPYMGVFHYSVLDLCSTVVIGRIYWEGGEVIKTVLLQATVN